MGGSSLAHQFANLLHAGRRVDLYDEFGYLIEMP